MMTTNNETPATRQPIRCEGCKATITRATVRAQARRLRKMGFSEDMIEYAMPRCGPCVRRWQRESFFGRISTMACRGMVKRKTVVPRVGGALHVQGTAGRAAARGDHDRPRTTRPETPNSGGDGSGAVRPDSYHPEVVDADRIRRLSDSQSEGLDPAESEETHV